MTGAQASPGLPAALRRGRVVIMLILMAIVGGCGPNRAQVHLCERVARVMEDELASVDVLQADRHPRFNNAIILDYQVTAPSGTVDTRWISCRFGDGSLASDPRALICVTTSREGMLSPVRTALLQIWLRLADRGPRPADKQPSALGPPSGPPCSAIHKHHCVGLCVCLDRAR